PLPPSAALSPSIKAASVPGCPERRSPLPTWPDAKGTGAFPRLAGQPHEYTSKTLMNWSKERGRDPTKLDTSAVCDCFITALKKFLSVSELALDRMAARRYPVRWSIRFRLCRAIISLALLLWDCLEPSHSHERHTVHGLHEHKSHEQYIPC